MIPLLDPLPYVLTLFPGWRFYAISRAMSVSVTPEHVADFSNLLQAFLAPDNALRKQVCVQSCVSCTQHNLPVACARVVRPLHFHVSFFPRVFDPSPPSRQAESAFTAVKTSNPALVCACLSTVVTSSRDEGVRTMAAVLLRQSVAARELWSALPADCKTVVTQNLVTRSAPPPLSLPHPSPFSARCCTMCSRAFMWAPYGAFVRRCMSHQEFDSPH